MKKNISNILMYILALPIGLLFYILSLFMLICFDKLTRNACTEVHFIWANFLHLALFFYGFNLALPNHKFVLTIVLSAIVLILTIVVDYWYYIINGFAFGWNQMWGDILWLSAIVYSCFASYNDNWGF